MKVKDLIEELKNVDPELDVYVWDAFGEEYTEASFTGVYELYKLEDGEIIYDDDDDPVMFDAFVISY